MVGDKKIEIVFVGKTAFPVSTASSNRILSIGKGMVHVGASVSVYCFGVTKFSSKANPIAQKGKIDNICWNFTSLRVTATSFRLINGLFLFVGQILGYFQILIKYYNKRPNFFTSQSGLGYIFPLWVLAKVCRGKINFFRSEYPIVKLKNNSLSKVYELLLYPITFKLFDGMFLMTIALHKYFSPWKNEKAFVKIAPLTIDVSLFSKHYDSPFNFDYIAYSGSLSNEKDGIDILIKAFGIIEKQFPNLRLVIIGGAKNEDDNQKLLDIVEEFVSLPEKVIFTGLIKTSILPKYLTNASILALARPNSLQAQGGFPSKVGEYLATGNPVVVTDTGEIVNYLENKVNALIAVPGDVDDFVSKLLWALKNKQKANLIGEKGQKVAIDQFNNIKIAEMMIKQCAN
jgi:glycosyltransferase involved in cell wall biosynthesis